MSAVMRWTRERETGVTPRLQRGAFARVGGARLKCGLRPAPGRQRLPTMFAWKIQCFLLAIQRSLGLDGLSASRNPIRGGRAKSCAYGVAPPAAATAPGLNAVIRAGGPQGALPSTVTSSSASGTGWKGPARGPDEAARHSRRCEASSRAAATILGFPRGPTRSRSRAASRRSRPTWPSRCVDALVAIGGEGQPWASPPSSTTSASNVVGVPKTIDNDLNRHRLHLRLSTTRGDTSRWRRSTGCTPPPSRTTAPLVVEVMGRPRRLDRAARPAWPAAAKRDPAARAQLRRGAGRDPT